MRASAYARCLYAWVHAYVCACVRESAPSVHTCGRIANKSFTRARVHARVRLCARRHSGSSEQRHGVRSPLLTGLWNPRRWQMANRRRRARCATGARCPSVCV
eukprot:6210233-Pleurochrysis_carterae.AAC.5